MRLALEAKVELLPMRLVLEAKVDQKESLSLVLFDHHLAWLRSKPRQQSSERQSSRNDKPS